jgi:hypothetical protein
MSGGWQPGWSMCDGDPAAYYRGRKMSGAERVAPWIFVIVGVAMIVLAAINYLSDPVAVAFAVIGAGLIVLGVCLGLLEGHSS